MAFDYNTDNDREYDFGSDGDLFGDLDRNNGVDANTPDDPFGAPPRKQSQDKKRSKKTQTDEAFPRSLLFKVLIIGIPVVLLIAFWEVVQEVLMSLLSIAVGFVVVIIVLKILFHKRK